MRPACIIVVEELLPEIRKAVARDLYRHGTSQEAISDLLGVSQAMVSRYLKGDPVRNLFPEDFLAPIIRNLSAYAIQGATPDEMTSMFCRRCQEMMGSEVFMRRYAERFPGSSIAACDIHDLGEGRTSVLEELSASARFLNGRDLHDLIPAVKMNMAQCTGNAVDRGDVASFPGRLQDTDGKVRQTSPPQFGVSRHLAGILLEAHAADPSIRAVISAGLSSKVRDAIVRMGLRSSDIDRDGSGILHFSGEIKKGIRILADPGDFGIEPCLYIMGGSSLEISRTVVDLQDTLNGMEAK